MRQVVQADAGERSGDKGAVGQADLGDACTMQKIEPARLLKLSP